MGRKSVLNGAKVPKRIMFGVNEIDDVSSCEPQDLSTTVANDCFEDGDTIYVYEFVGKFKLTNVPSLTQIETKKRK